MFIVGGYGVRNKEKTREFLKMWADLEHDAPMGFHSSDNGAIHLALMIWFIGRNDTRVQQCFEIYRALNDSVENLTPYWNFVNCARRTLGMGEWEGAYDEQNNGPKDPILKKFREFGLELQSQGITVRIFPRFKAKLIRQVNT